MLSSTPPKLDEWKRYIQFSGAVSSTQRTRLDNFFNRLSRTSAGRLILTEIRNRTSFVNTVAGLRVPFSNHIKPLEIEITNSVEKEDALGLYRAGTRMIDIGPRAFQTRQYTKNEDGSAYLFEQVLLHELVHFLLDDNAGFNSGGSQFTQGAFLKAAGGAANQAFLSGRISRQDYDYILEPFRNFSGFDGELFTEETATALFREIFGPISDSGYYFGLNTTSGINDFNYSEPLPVTSDAELNSIKELLNARRDVLASKLEAADVFEEVAKRADEKGVIDSNNIKFIQGVVASHRKNKGGLRKQDDAVRTDFVVDEFGVFTGVYSYSIDLETGEQSVESYSIYSIPRNEDGSPIEAPSGGWLPPTHVRNFSNNIESISTLRPGTFETIDIDIKIPNNPVPFEFSDIGGLLGQQLGYRIAGNNAILGTLGASYPSG